MLCFNGKPEVTMLVYHGLLQKQSKLKAECLLTALTILIIISIKSNVKNRQNKHENNVENVEN